MTDGPNPDEVSAALAGPDLAGWTAAEGALHARFATDGFAAGLALVVRIGEAAEELDHHPDLDLRYTYVDVRSSSHDVGGLTRRDLRLARRINSIAAELGVSIAASP